MPALNPGPLGLLASPVEGGGRSRSVFSPVMSSAKKVVKHGSRAKPQGGTYTGGGRKGGKRGPAVKPKPKPKLKAKPKARRRRGDLAVLSSSDEGSGDEDLENVPSQGQREVLCVCVCCAGRHTRPLSAGLLLSLAGA